ncbi:hypothetical protein AKJ16_DCAP18441 [Drosera capensis]
MAGAEDVFDSDRGRSGESDSGEDVDEESESKAAIKDSIVGGGETTIEYEKQRLWRIRQNRERMKALGLIGAAKSPHAKVAEEDDDDEYMPCDEDQSGPSESDSDVTKAATNSRSRSQSLSRSRSRSRKMKRKISTPRKKASDHTIDCSESVDEEKALMQAIALSLEDSHAVPLGSYAGTSRKLNLNVNEINNDTGKRKKRSKVPNRVQMTENDVVIHFCQFDVVGKGSITKRDLQRMAACHDFIWTDKEFDDMIRCFDCNGDGKLSLDEFRNIVSRCGMLQGFHLVASKPVKGLSSLEIMEKYPLPLAQHSHNDVTYKVINVEKVAIVKDEALNTLIEKDRDDHDVQRCWRQLDQLIMMKRNHCKLCGGAVRLRGMDELAAAAAGRSRSRQKQIIKGKRSCSFSRLGIRRRKLGGHRGGRAVSVLWQSLTIPRIRKGSSSAPQPDFDLDYAHPKVHPGTHN